MRRKVAFLTGVAAVVSGVVAWGHWTAGAPPTWSYFGDHARTRVLISEVVDDPDKTGRDRHQIHVEVAWPPGSTEARPLEGVEPVHVPKMLWTAAQIVRSYPVGEKTSVRVVGGAPYADRTDMTEMAYAIFFSIATLACLVIAVLLARGGTVARNGEGQA